MDVNPQFNWTDTAFVSLSMILVFIMTPANGFFYGGTVEFKNAISVIFMCFFTLTIVTIQWYFFGFSLAFSPTANNKFIGDFTYGAWTNMFNVAHPNCPTIPAYLYLGFQLMFATVTPALAFGSIAERTRILPWMIFLFVWCTLVYDVIAFWSWSPNGWLNQWGFKDFAGGLPVHMVSGFSGLVACIMIGKRVSAASMPHNLTHTVLGTALFWFGWFGFNGGSECRMNARAVNAMMITHLAASFGAVTWILYDYRLHQKITSLGFCSGAIAGLVCITPASGFVSAYTAPVFGIVGSLVGNWACFLKSRFEFDDTLDAFAVHGAVGFAGSILTGIFADAQIEGMSNTVSDPTGGWISKNWPQVGIQLAGSLAGIAYTCAMTALIIYIFSKIQFTLFGKKVSLNLRMNTDDEMVGSDFSLMGEVAYDFTHTGQKHIEAMMS